MPAATKAAEVRRADLAAQKGLEAEEAAQLDAREKALKKALKAKQREAAKRNRASERVAEKLGFVREGVLREELLIRGIWTDHSLYSILEHEFRTMAARAPQPD